MSIILHTFLNFKALRTIDFEPKKYVLEQAVKSSQRYKK